MNAPWPLTAPPIAAAGFRESGDTLFLDLGRGAPKAALSLLAAGDMGFGDDHNRERRAAWLARAGLDPLRAASVDLVHSRRVAEAIRPDYCRGLEADGIVAPAPRGPTDTAALVITVADCMPVYLWDPDSGAFGLLHSGWTGTGILAEAVALMAERYGSRPARLSVAFGPCIGSCCYVVDEDRARAYEREFGPSAVVRSEGRPRLDLVAANRGIAERLGLGAPIVSGACTACGGRFGSFRRQGAGRFTRMAAAIGYPA